MEKEARTLSKRARFIFSRFIKYAEMMQLSTDVCDWLEKEVNAEQTATRKLGLLRSLIFRINGWVEAKIRHEFSRKTVIFYIKMLYYIYTLRHSCITPEESTRPADFRIRIRYPILKLIVNHCITEETNNIFEQLIRRSDLAITFSCEEYRYEKDEQIRGIRQSVSRLLFADEERDSEEECMQNYVEKKKEYMALQSLPK